jgi:hypothetical protein
MKRTSITATYRPNESEAYQCTISLPATWPDALDEARMQAVRCVREMLTDAMALVPREVEPEAQ